MSPNCDRFAARNTPTALNDTGTTRVTFGSLIFYRVAYVVTRNGCNYNAPVKACPTGIGVEAPSLTVTYHVHACYRRHCPTTDNAHTNTTHTHKRNLQLTTLWWTAT